MIKYQQQHPTNSLIQSPLTSTSQASSKSFKQRINQLKAKVKPSLGVASIDSNLDPSQILQTRLPSQQPKINIVGVHKVLSPMSQFNDLENLSEKKVIDMRVSYRATNIKNSQSRQKSLQADVRQYLSLNKVNGKLLFPCSEKECQQIQGKRIKNQQKRKLEQYDKQNKNSNIQRNAFEIEDILITNYKSPNKTDRSLGSTMKVVNHKNSKDNFELNLLGSDLSKLYTKQSGKEENKHIKKISQLNLSSNISIDVRQCSARYNTEYGGLIEGKKNQKKKKENNSTSRHMKTQSATYRIK